MISQSHLQHSENSSRRLFPKGRNILLGAFLVAALAACHPTFENRGNLPDPEAVSKVVPGKSTKADVTRLLGSPSTVGTFDPNVWYYVNRQSDRVAFYDPELLRQKIYVVEFDAHGTVRDLQTHDNDAHDVDMIARTTPAPGRELTFLEQLVGNFGSANKSKKAKSKDDE